MIKKISSFCDQLTLPSWSVPFILLGVSFFAFGLLASNLGFYMDDWHHVHYKYLLGDSGIKEMLLYGSNRPYAGWFYILGFNTLGFKPLNWHIAELILRWATASVFWLFFRSLWPKYHRQALYISLLFLIYPFFMMQPMAVAYSLHWMGFFLYALSLWLMVVAEKQTRKYGFIIVGAALIAEGYHLVTSEYFSGLELLRPFILWILIARREKNTLKRISKTFLQWLPYLLVLVVYAYWRAFLLPLPPEGDRNAPVILYQFFIEPIKTFSQISVIAIKDISFILFNSWHSALSSDVFNLSSHFTRYVLLIIGVCFVIVFVFLNKLYFQVSIIEESENEKKTWYREMIMLGFTALFLGPLPIWFIGKAISTHKNQMAATRFGLPSMLGAALLLVVLIEYFITDRKRANIVVALGVALAIGVHLNNAHWYEYSWEKQVGFYQQLVQRVPDLEPDTAIISAGEIFPVMGEYPTAYAINTIFSREGAEEETDYWFFSIYSFYEQIDVFLNGMLLDKQFLLSEFSGNSKEILFISFEPGLGQCLWVLRPEDSDLRLISQLEREASLNSAINRIQIEEKNIRVLPPEIFGDEIPQNWCSYYQKADLARQRGEWGEVTNLWEEAQTKDKRPENGFEYIPFIEGYAYQGNWEQVKTLTKQANKVSPGMSSILCSTLRRIENATSFSEERVKTRDSLNDYLGCQE